MPGGAVTAYLPDKFFPVAQREFRRQCREMDKRPPRTEKELRSQLTQAKTSNARAMIWARWNKSKETRDEYT